MIFIGSDVLTHKIDAQNTQNIQNPKIQKF